MAGFFDRLRYGFLPDRQPARPFKEQGVAGFVMMGGIPNTNETNHRLLGSQRWKTAAEMLANVSIIAAGLRYTLNLTARPKWKANPVNDTAEAKAAAEFVDEIIENTDRSWSRIIRTSAMYRFHGFQINEWVASKRDDGKIGIQTVEVRPQHTIERWDLDQNGGVTGVWQRDPQTSQEIYLPRSKIVYLVDDSFTDRPDGMGVFRHLVEDWNQLKVYLKLERMGFQRDLVGLPVGRVPLSRVNQLVQEGKITAQQRDDMIAGIRDFVSMESKSDTTGLMLDSSPYRAKTDTGETISSVMEWGIDLITGEQNSVEQLGAAIKRTQFDMALVMGTSSLLTGREGEGSRALSEDQSRNLYLGVNSSLNDMAEAYDRDIIGPVWAMNGMDEKLRPKLTHEDASFKDVEQIAATLQKMAAAGAILAPDDPAINDLRNLMGVSEAEEMSIEDLALIRGAGKTPPGEEGGEGGTGPGGKPKPGNDNKDPKDAPRGAEERRGATASKFDPSQPRDPAGTSTGGRWTSGGGGVIMVKDKHGNEAPVTKNSSLAKYLVRNEDGTYSLDSEREELHDRIVEQFLAGVEKPTGQPQMFMTGGGPASGKSSILVADESLPGQHEAVQVDPDAIKFQLPEFGERFRAGDKGASSFVHEESSMIRRRLEAAAIAGRYNVMLDTTGDSSVDKLQRNLEGYRAAGYAINASYATLDTNLAVRLAADRGRRTGRYVPESFIRETHANVSRTFQSAVNRNLFDSVTLYDTNELGNVRIVGTGSRKGFVILDNKRWDDFVAKGNTGDATVDIEGRP